LETVGVDVVVDLAFPLIGLYVLYWVVRFGVRHGIEDAWRRRDNPEE